ncbi:hypothetical protein [Paenibacillus maysiensis]|uniref:hypothetical protein n=1 Tax=Paenibacillus maysiensis TaxID=1155954 RepID=UPI00047170E2|nr:hypothetical protein [Paenibacillus maysiensis]
MPTISKIRFTHVIYENGNKRYNNETFEFHGHNGAIVLENGGGKTVFIQMALQAVLPHTDLAGRKLKDTLQLDNGPAHIAVEWILNDKPRRRYAVTCISLFQSGNGIDSFRYVYEYGEHDEHGLDQIPFVRTHLDKLRPADKGEMQDYYASMEQRFSLQAKTFSTITKYKEYLEKQFQIIIGEWEAIVQINDTEGGIEKFFDECKTTTQLFDRLLIPRVERSIEGYEQGVFVKMFETHREGFKRYKELKEQIEENKRILQELGQYVKRCERWDDVQQNYEESRAEAKAYWMLSLEQGAELALEKNNLLSQEETWRNRRNMQMKKGKSLEIFRRQQEMGAWETRSQLIGEDLERAEDQFRAAEKQFHSLQYAESRDKQQQLLARIKQLEDQLGRLSYSEDEQGLQERWERNGAQLKYVFAVKEQTLAQRQTEKEQLLQELSKLVEAMDAKRRELEREFANREKLLLRNEENQRGKREQMENISRSILANSQLEKVELQIPIWTEEEQRLERERIELLQELKRLDEERNAMEHRRRQAGEERAETERDLARLQEQEKRWHNEHEEIKLELIKLRPSWERLGSLHEKQASMMKQIEEVLERLRQQKQKLLLKERLAYRFVDDHGDQVQFFADVVVGKFCEQWSHQFSLLQSGMEYVQSVDAGTVSQEHTADRLWAVTLITTEHEKPALWQKLQQASESFAFPIRVLSAQEAAYTLQGQRQAEGSDGLWVVPGHWLSNEQPEQFTQWKAELLEQANLVRSEREKIETDIANWQSVQQRFTAFLAKYPLAVQQELEQKRLSAQARLSERTRELERLEHDLQVNRKLEDSQRKMGSEKSGRMVQLGMWLQQGHLYMRLHGEVDKLEQEHIPVRQQLELLHRQLEREINRIKQKQTEHVSLTEDVRDVQMQTQLLRQDERYAEVQPFASVSSEGTIEELKETRKGLDWERRRIFQTRAQLEMSLSREQESERDCAGTMKSLLIQHPELDVDLLLPLEVEVRKQNAWADIVDGREQVNRVKHEQMAVEKELQSRTSEIATLSRQFVEQFPGEEPERFQESLRNVEARLEEEKTALQLESEQLQQRQQQLHVQQQELDHALGLWNKHLLIHALEDVRLSAAVLGTDQQTEFGYKRRHYTEQCIHRLSEQHERLTAEQKRVLEARNQFKDFCAKEVKDVKLRQMTIQGIETKERYQEIRDFQSSMEQRIQMVIHLGEQTLQTLDQDLQEYIQRIHTHLKLIMQELKEIPKKTRVKTEDGWKEIYSFIIPGWEEQVGKERLRKHMEWIITKLDQYATRPELGSWQEQQATIRKELDKWLDSRQLLQIILAGEGMKVSCHKVTNDQQVTRAAYSWEQSNRWSGGEKWSKNMTLFLGLLNYVAERKQYIQSKMKRYRTVILDNPFGKASSDHVLSPVFFIAEQLGFQMIALTAHMEGKFLQDYFPIVYSCRLRHAADSSKQIVQASQQIQAAYFRDNDPDTLERMGARVSQIELF